MRNFFFIVGAIFAVFYLCTRFSVSNSAQTSLNNPIAEREHNLNQLVLLQPLKQHDAQINQDVLKTANAAQSNQVVDAVAPSLWWTLRRVVEQRADDQGQYLWAQAYVQQLYDARRADRCFEIAFPLYNKTPPQQLQ